MPADRRPLPLAAMIAASVAVPFLLAAAAAWNAREAALRDLDRRAAAAADLVAVHGQRFLETAEQVMRRAGDRARSAPAAELAADRAVHEDLAAMVEETGVVDALWIFAADGGHVVGSEGFPIEPRSPADREFLAAPLGLPVGRVHVSAPFVGRVTGRAVFALSARVPGPEGQAPAVAVATISPAAVQDFYARLQAGSDYVVGLTREDGHVLARYPDLDGRLVRLGPATGLMRALAAPGGGAGGAFTSVAQLGGVERRYAYRPVPDHPTVHASVGVATAEAAARWRAEAALYLLLAAAGSALLVAMLLRVRAAQRARERAAAELADARAELLQAQKLDALGRLTGGVAHDFSNLLAAVAGAARGLRRGGSDPAALLDGIDLAVERGALLTRRLLGFSRRDAVRTEVVDLGEALERARPMVGQAGRPGVAIAVVRPHPDPLPVLADPAELELSVLNLVSNAVDALPGGGEVRVSASLQAAEGLAVLEVADDGVGMPEEVRDRALEPFFTTKGPDRGTGLGLAAVHGFARRAGGRVEIDSAPGRGTRVRVLLPLAAVRPGGAQEGAREEPEPGAPEVRRVLVAEDDVLVAMGTRAGLEDAGFEVEVARNAAEALARLDAEPDRFQALVSDVSMPGALDGAGLAREAAARHPRLRVVLLTDHRADGLDVPAGVAVLSKPCAAEDLAARLRDPSAAPTG
jgi:two-component system NtrC family sensor kinase